MSISGEAITDGIGDAAAGKIIVPLVDCKLRSDVSFSLLATNVNRNIAVWFEPHPDPQVDQDKSNYEATFGPGNFYAAAPRVSDWEEFKETILKFERGELVGKPPSHMNFQAMLGAQKPLGRKPSLLSRLFNRK